MARIYGKEFTRWELMKKVGDVSQLSGARQCTLGSGWSKGLFYF